MMWIICSAGCERLDTCCQLRYNGYIMYWKRAEKHAVGFTPAPMQDKKSFAAVVRFFARSKENQTVYAKKQGASLPRNPASVSGFTLVEMLIVMSLVLILIAVAAMYNKTASRQIMVSREHAKVLTAFVRARSEGLAIPKTDPSVEHICAYGVHVDPASRTIVLFKDLGSIAPASCASANHRYDGDRETIQRIVLDATVAMTAVRLSDVVFIPPNGDVIISDTDGKTMQSATVTVAGANNEFVRGVKINTFGQITEFQPTP